MKITVSILFYLSPRPVWWQGLEKVRWLYIRIDSFRWDIVKTASVGKKEAISLPLSLSLLLTYPLSQLFSLQYFTPSQEAADRRLLCPSILTFPSLLEPLHPLSLSDGARLFSFFPILSKPKKEKSESESPGAAPPPPPPTTSTRTQVFFCSHPYSDA